MIKVPISSFLLLLVMSCASSSAIKNQITLNIKGSVHTVEENEIIDISYIVGKIVEDNDYRGRSFSFRVVSPGNEYELIRVDVEYITGRYKYDNFTLENGSIVYIPHSEIQP